MSLLSIVQEGLAEIGQFEIPATIFQNTNPTAIQSLAIINRSIKSIAKRLNQGDYTVQTSFNTVINGETNVLQRQYDVPNDFQKIVPQTMRINGIQIIDGPISSEEWARNKLEPSNTGRPSFRYFKNDGTEGIFFGGGFNFLSLHLINHEIDQTWSYEYTSSNLVLSSLSIAQEGYILDDDEAVIDEELVLLGFKWRFLKAKGLPYAEEMVDFEEAMSDYQSKFAAPIVDFTDGISSPQNVQIIYRST